MQAKREHDEQIRQLYELEQEVWELEEREPAAEIAECLLDEPFLLSMIKRLYVKLTIHQAERARKEWNRRDGSLRWNDYLDDASEEEVSILHYSWGLHWCSSSRVHTDIF